MSEQSPRSLDVEAIRQRVVKVIYEMGMLLSATHAAELNRRVLAEVDVLEAALRASARREAEQQEEIDAFNETEGVVEQERDSYRKSWQHTREQLEAETAARVQAEQERDALRKKYAGFESRAYYEQQLDNLKKAEAELAAARSREAALREKLRERAEQWQREAEAHRPYLGPEGYHHAAIEFKQRCADELLADLDAGGQEPTT